MAGTVGTGGAAGDVLTNIEVLYGSAYNDTVGGSANADYLFGDAGNDVLTGEAGNDELYGGLGDDNLERRGRRRLAFGRRGQRPHQHRFGCQRVYAGDGDDVVIGGADRDVVYGGVGNDQLFGMTATTT